MMSFTRFKWLSIVILSYILLVTSLVTTTTTTRREGNARGAVLNKQPWSLFSAFETVDSVSQRLKKQLEQQLQRDKKLSVLEARQQLLRTRLLSGLNMNRTFVAPSQVAGRGLFALENISNGDLLTCYPGDALVILSERSTDVHWGDHVLRDHHGDDTINQEYMLHASHDDWGIVALPDLDQDPSYLGHFANDGACAPTTASALSSYVIESNDWSNAMHQDLMGCHMVTVATRDIREGEEIFVTYGPEYWMEQDSFGMEDAGGGSMASILGEYSISPNGKGFG